MWPQRDGQSYVLLDTSTTDTLPLNHEFFRPLGMEHFYDSFALESQISVRGEALHLFGLREDELLSDLHITRDGVLRIRLSVHQEHRVNYVTLTPHEKNLSPEQAMSEGDATDSDGSESASDSEQNEPSSSLVADAEQYELMQIFMLLWAKTSKTSLAVMILLDRNTASSRNWRRFQKDGHWHGYPCPCKHVFWLAARKFRSHVL